MTDPLDRPIWHALAGRQAAFAIGEGLARRFDPGVEPFVACADDSDAALGAVAGLLGAADRVLFLQRGRVPVPPGCREVERGLGVQMVATRFSATAPPGGIVPLSDGDAREMVALAKLDRKSVV